MKSKKMQQFSVKTFLSRYWFEVLGLVFWFCLGTWFYLHAMQWRADGWYFGHGNVWSDWSLHVSQVTRFVVTPPSEWWSMSTYFAGGKYTYPFVSNLLSAGLIRLGLSYPAALIGPSILFWAATLATLFWFGRWIIGSGKAAVVAITIFFCSAGLGLLRIFDSPNWWSLFIAPVLDYTQFTQYQWGTGNLFLGMFLPQRAFLLGFWVALLAWGMWLQTLEETWSPSSQKKLVFAGVLAGFLPILHMHSFMAIALMSLPVAVRFAQQKWRESAVFATITGLISVPLYYLFVSGGIENPAFFQVNLWWTTDNLGDWLIQWMWQWGIALPVAAYSLVLLYKKVSPVRWWALASFWGVFLMANIIQFQPTAWDNTKLFLWVYWGISLQLAWYLCSLWRRGAEQKFLVIFLFLLLTFTGARELLRSADLDRYTYQATSVQSYDLARQVRQEVGPNDVFLTAPVHNHWVTMWAGRPIVMGYSAWVWNFGFLYAEREDDVRKIFLSTAERQSLLQKYSVSYVVVGPDERYHYPNLVPFEYPVAFSSQDTVVYRVRSD